MSTSLRQLRTTMTGRDPHEQGRAATPLELIFDLTFVIAFGAAADELAHYVTESHVVAGIAGFCFATFAVSWAWINVTWFASAFDTDDWLYRLTTMVQMVGVLVLALGLSDMFESLADGDRVDNRVMVLGYVVMRVPMLFQWWRAGHADPSRAALCQTMMVSLVVAQAGWIALALLDPPTSWSTAGVAVLIAVEFAGPLRAASQGEGTPWHPHHIAERYGLLIIIALGEGLLGTTEALKNLVDEGWSADVAVLGVAGVALTFGMYWIYFIVPSGDLLHARPERSFGWGYGQIPIFGAAVAVGGGLHAAAYFLAEESSLSLVGTVVSVAAPLGIYVVGVFALWTMLTRRLNQLHLLLILGSAVVIALSLLMALAGLSLSWCLLVLALTPWVSVVAHETLGLSEESSGPDTQP